MMVAGSIFTPELLALTPLILEKNTAAGLLQLLSCLWRSSPPSNEVLKRQRFLTKCTKWFQGKEEVLFYEKRFHLFWQGVGFQLQRLWYRPFALTDAEVDFIQSCVRFATVGLSTGITASA